MKERLIKAKFLLIAVSSILVAGVITAVILRTNGIVE